MLIMFLFFYKRRKILIIRETRLNLTRKWASKTKRTVKLKRRRYIYLLVLRMILFLSLLDKKKSAAIKKKNSHVILFSISLTVCLNNEGENLFETRLKISDGKSLTKWDKKALSTLLFFNYFGYLTLYFLSCYQKNSFIFIKSCRLKEI